MMNPVYFINQVRDLVEEFKPSRERSLAITKLDEFEMWLAKCEPTEEALQRDQMAVLPGTEKYPIENKDHESHTLS